MIWNVVDVSSETESIFEQENPTLEAVLGASDLFDKCHEHYDPLIEYITQDDVFLNIIKYITQEHDAKNFNKTQYKYSNISSELVKTTDATTTKLVTFNTETNEYPFLDRLLDYFSRDESLNTLSASLVCRVLIHSIGFSNQNNNHQVLDRLTTHPNFTKKIFHHTNCGAVIDFLLHMTSIEDKNLHIPLGKVINRDFFLTLVNFFQPSYAPEYYESIAFLFNNISSNLRRKLSENYTDDTVTSMEEVKFYENTLDLLESEELINDLVTRLTRFYLSSEVFADETQRIHREYLAPNIFRILNSFLTNQSNPGSQNPFLNLPKDTSNDSFDRTLKPALDPKITYQKLACIKILSAFTSRLEDIKQILCNESLVSTEIDAHSLPNGPIVGYSRITLIQCLQMVSFIGVEHKTSPDTYNDPGIKNYDDNSQTQDSTMSGSSPMQTNEDELTEKALNGRIDRCTQQLLEAFKEKDIIPLLFYFIQRFPMNTFLVESCTNIIQNFLVHSGYPIVQSYDEDEDKSKMDFQEKINAVFSSAGEKTRAQKESDRVKVLEKMMTANEQFVGILEYIIKDCKLAEWLMLMNPVMIFDKKLDEAIPKNPQEVSNGKERPCLVAKSIKIPKPGYSGHIWKMANFLLLIEDFYKDKGDLETFIKCFHQRSDYDRWREFVSTCLNQINQDSKIEPIETGMENTNSNSRNLTPDDVKNFMRFQSMVKDSTSRIGDFIKILNPDSFNIYNSTNEEEALRMPDSYQTPSSGKDSASPAPINETFEWAMKPILNSSDPGRNSECSNDDSDDSDDSPTAENNSDDSESDSDGDLGSSSNGSGAPPRVISQKKNILLDTEFAPGVPSTRPVIPADATNTSGASVTNASPSQETKADPWAEGNGDDSNNSSLNNTNLKSGSKEKEDWADFSSVVLPDS